MGNASHESQQLSASQREELLNVLSERFNGNMHRHAGMKWNEVRARLQSQPHKLWSLREMELSGGEADVVCFDPEHGSYVFYDCSPESPVGRRSLCYDRAALDSRKKNKPASSAMDMATAMGVELLTEQQYRYLQTLGAFDTRTSSWVKTPDIIRELGGALFCDRRYDTVFLYHNGADSYYAARGFRGSLSV